MQISVIGAGVAGLCAAVTLAERGASVTVHERAGGLGPQAASWLAGGMLAPWCETESADRAIVEPGLAAIDWWAERVPDVRREGTLVIAPARDSGELSRFARRIGNQAERLDEAGLAALEPVLAGRFRQSLHYPQEAHLDPRKALEALAGRLSDLDGSVCFGSSAEPAGAKGDIVVDCRGIAGDQSELRPVRGEMLILRTSEVTLSRPVRLLHPRMPVYVVPREAGRFMVGATMLESGSTGGVTLRSAVELMNAAYAIHPAFAEAEVEEMSAGLRPSFSDNLPRVTQSGRVVSVNGLYRHGFLLAPSCAREAADLIFGQTDQKENAA
ncbi:THIAMINE BIOSYNTHESIS OXIDOREDUCTASE THIO [Fulvimarina pelagi HTCC2506]|uniref:THIAMINE BIOSYNTHESIS OXIDOREDUCTASE THIO n=1 Tax=Fulvimarina pelagi HTCC2506 TaxID=314231 RepID=Q0G7W2_9HYPH|nr:glycine oxidase ThiO [Fulvimarina pelagi]EAU42252.1 THIAMINE BIOSYNTHESIS OXIDOREDUCTASE THIO [Fulvimarina pelagi HTCC2506]